MSVITDLEFDTMVKAILLGDERDEMLFVLVGRIVSPTIYAYCGKGQPLCGRQEDLFQDICMRVIKKFVTGFWNKTDENGNVNRSAEYFVNWLRRLAKNYLNDEYQKALILKHREIPEPGEGEPPVTPPPPPIDEWELDAMRERLCRAFSIVLDAYNEIYIVLTWLGQSLMILEMNEDKHRLNEPFLATYRDKTLYEMRDLLYRAAGRIDWLLISDDQRQRIDAALDKPYRDGCPYGSIPYSKFLTKKADEATISDWYYRMNKKIQKVMKNETHNGG